MEAKAKIVVEPIPLERALDEAYKQGMKEVVEWLNKNIHLYLRNDDKFVKEWQAKLKEWGIK